MIGTRCVYVACGANHMGICMEDGSVYCWGRNEYGQLGNPQAVQGSYVPLKVIMSL